MRDLLAGVFGAWLIWIAVAKFLAAKVLDRSPWGELILGVAVLEIGLGALLLWRGGMRSTWIPVIAFCLGLAGMAVAGPALPECYCLGSRIALDAPGRTALALLMLATAMAGWGMPTRSSSGAGVTR